MDKKIHRTREFIVIQAGEAKPESFDRICSLQVELDAGYHREAEPGGIVRPRLGA